MPDLILQAHHSQTYDVYFTVSGGPRFVLWLKNHGITVGDRDFCYSVDGNVRRMAYNDIAAIHLSNGAVGGDIIDQCKIALSSGDTITVSNAAPGGLPNQEQTQAYRDFVRDLHGRLAACDHGRISFMAGMSTARYKGAFAAIVIAGLFFVATPLMLAMITGDVHALILMATGAFFIWPFMRMLSHNMPRYYTPEALPDELIS